MCAATPALTMHECMVDVAMVILLTAIWRCSPIAPQCNPRLPRRCMTCAFCQLCILANSTTLDMTVSIMAASACCSMCWKAAPVRQHCAAPCMRRDCACRCCAHPREHCSSAGTGRTLHAGRSTTNALQAAVTILLCRLEQSSASQAAGRKLCLWCRAP